MPEPLSAAFVAGYAMTLHLATHGDSAVSPEAAAIRRSVFAAIESAERSIALFGAKSAALSRLYELAGEYAKAGWDFEGAAAVPPDVISRTAEFIRALPSWVALPEIAVEPDGSLSLDWIRSRTQVFSVSIGKTSRLPYAWIDGTDRGHGVARFDESTIPSRILSGVREITNGGTVPFRVA